MHSNQSFLIAIEGLDGSGKETQSRLLFERLNKEGYRCALLSFPDYSSPTGRIIAGPYLGRKGFSESWFKEGASHLDPKIASVYYAADRRYALPKLKNLVLEGKTIILDRYVEANMAYQGAKITNPSERIEFFKSLDFLEYEFFELPRPDLTIFLYLPFEISREITLRRGNQDSHEKDEQFLRNVEKSYMQLYRIYGWTLVDYSQFIDFNNPRKGIQKAHEHISEIVLNFLKKEKESF